MCLSGFILLSWVDTAYHHFHKLRLIFHNRWPFWRQPLLLWVLYYLQQLMFDVTTRQVILFFRLETLFYFLLTVLFYSSVSLMYYEHHSIRYWTILSQCLIETSRSGLGNWLWFQTNAASSLEDNIQLLYVVHKMNIKVRLVLIALRKQHYFKVYIIE